MKSACDILRPGFCLLSVILLGLLGGIGEEALNFPIYRDICKDLSHAPAPTAFFLGNFHVNACHFVLSLTPFMVLMTAIAALSFDRRLSDLYRYFFGGVWLLALSYIVFFAWALPLPFHLLAKAVGDSPVPGVVYTLDIVIMSSIAAYWLIARRKLKRDEPDAALHSRPRSQLPVSSEIQSSDSLRTPSPGGCG